MMSRGLITAELRQETGKGAARRLRQQGQIPGVLYGKKRDTVDVQLNQAALQRLVTQYGAGRLIDLELNGGKEVVLLRDIQRDPVRDLIQHVDFYAIALDEETTAVVPLIIMGEETRQADGGVVTPAIREIEVACLPTAIPERLEIDVSNMLIGDTLTLEDIEFPEGVKPTAEPEEVVVSVTIPRAVVETDEDAEDEEAVDGEETEASEETADEAEEA